jgi:hypothetical protein
MAKKVVATLKKGDSAQFTKVVKMTKSAKSGAYTFEERIVNKELVKDFFK